MKAGTISYCSTYDSPAVMFFATRGTKIKICATPVSYASTRVFGGAKGLSDPDGPFLGLGYSSLNFLLGGFQFTATRDDLYMVVWIKSSAMSGEILAACVDAVKLGMVLTDYEDAEEPPDELMMRLEDAFERVLGR